MHVVVKKRTFSPIQNSLAPAEEKAYVHRLNPPLTFDSLAQLFASPHKVIEQINEHDRYNLYYTLYHSHPEPSAAPKERLFSSQDVIAFDVDKILIQEDGSFSELYGSVFCSLFKLDQEKIVTVFSGHGLHFLIQLEQGFDSIDYFKKHKKLYTLACQRFQDALTSAGLEGIVDNAIFHHQSILRLPGTRNIKKGQVERMCVVHGSGILEAQGFCLNEAAGGEKKTKTKKAAAEEGKKTTVQKASPQEDQTSSALKKVSQAKDETETAAEPQKKETLKNLPEKALRGRKFDKTAILQGCDFLKWMQAHQPLQNEPQWQAMASVLAKLDDQSGEKLFQEYSSKSPQYSEGEARSKYQYALKSDTGPRTCSSISETWPGCSKCPNFGRVASPVLIVGEEFVATEKCGFMTIGPRGAMQPDYEGLRKFFFKETGYVTDESSESVFAFNGTHYVRMSPARLKNYAASKFFPDPSVENVKEWIGRVARNNLQDLRGFNISPKINFANGTLDPRDGKMHAHNREDKFLYCLPFNYEPGALCPEFDAMMDRISVQDKKLQQILLEFIGYALCDRSYDIQKSLVLKGEGANGKSTLLRVVEMLAGDENYSVLSIDDLLDETARTMLIGKIMNISEEMPAGRMKSTDVFKKLLGGKTTARFRYGHHMQMSASVKYFFACNEAPNTSDTSSALYRRLIVVPFDAEFKEDKMDHGLLDRLRLELPGIFNKVYAAWQGLKARGNKMTQCDRVDQELDEYRQNNNPLMDWVQMSLEIVPTESGHIYHSHMLGHHELFERYLTWLGRLNSRGITFGQFKKELPRVIPGYKERVKRINHGKAGRHTMVRGLRWIDGTASKVEAPEAGFANGKDHGSGLEIGSVVDSGAVL